MSSMDSTFRFREASRTCAMPLYMEIQENRSFPSRRGDGLNSLHQVHETGCCGFGCSLPKLNTSLNSVFFVVTCLSLSTGRGFARTITTLSSNPIQPGRQQGQEAGRDCPVFFPDHGRPAHVLLTIEEYLKLSSRLPGTGDPGLRSS